jgi:hypothetical protein
MQPRRLRYLWSEMHLYLSKYRKKLGIKIETQRKQLSVLQWIGISKTLMDKLGEPKNYKIAGTLEIAQELAINLFRLESEGLKAIDNKKLSTIQKDHLKDN